MKIPFIQTYSGLRMEFLNPSQESISIIDIAHALSMICRFNGNTTSFYSVADHSLRVSSIVPNHLKLQALMHDASETYIADISRPVKKQLSGYKEIEDVIMKAISVKYGFDWPMSPEVVEADNNMLITEKRDLIIKTNWDWGVDYVPYPDIIVPRSQKEVETLFLKEFERLTV